MKGDFESPIDKITEVIYDRENIFTRLPIEIIKSKGQIDICIKITNNSSISSIIELLIKAIEEIKSNRKIKSRCIINNTKENLDYFTKLISVVDEIRYSELINSSFFINETTYVSIASFQKIESMQQQKSLPFLIINTVESFVLQQQLFFNLLWNNSTISEYAKIKDVKEEGNEDISKSISKDKPIKTQVIQNQQEIFNTLINFYKTSNEIKFCSPTAALNIIYNNFFNLHQEILDRYRQGNHKGIRWITSLNKEEDIELVKKYVDKGIEVRHVKDLLPTSFVLSDKALLFTIEKIEEGKWGNNILSSNDKLYLEHYDVVFENLWKSGIDINERIKDIKKGNITNVDLIPNGEESIKIFNEIFNSAKKEVLIILSSANAFFRIDDNIGFKEIEKLTFQGIKAKILIPLRIELKNKTDEVIRKHPKIEFRYLHNALETLIGITVIDREKVIILEIKDDAKRNYIDSIGLTIFIQGKSAALSYTSIFDSLWKQTELYEQLKEAFLQAQIHEKMQKEFINTAAHELRTPIQPILGISNILKNSIKDEKQSELIDVIARNAKRLKKLAEDILDVSKIESNLLHLNKENFVIKEIVQDTISDYKNELFNKNIDIIFIAPDDFIIFADKEKISQVISNLLSNSIKFIPGEKRGKISITVEKKIIYKNDSDRDFEERDTINHMAIISIKDNGIGIDEGNISRLFTKFTTTSFQGIGLGLFISKNIVEAHGGKIWAKKNEDENRGATFSFSIPLETNKNHISSCNYQN